MDLLRLKSCAMILEVIIKELIDENITDSFVGFARPSMDLE